MKIVLLTLALAVNVFWVNAQKTWTGGASGNWGVSGNWTPSGIPGGTDDVVISNNATVTLDVTPIINSLKITGGVSVTLASSVSRTITLSSTAVSPKGLQIDAGNTLTLDCTNASGTNNLILSLTGNIGVTGQVDGNLYFTASGNSSSAAARFSTFSGAVSYANMIVGPTGYIKFFNNSGNATTSSTTFTMQSGATYEINKNGGSFPNGVWNSGSLCYATGATTAGPSFLGNTYGNLEWNCPAQTTAYGFNGNFTFNNIKITSCNTSDLRVKTGGAATSFVLTINGNLEVNAGATLLTSSTTVLPPNGGIIELKGNLINNGTISETGPAGTKDTLNFSGSSAQAISGSGTITNSLSIKISNAAGVTLNSPVILPYHLYLSVGKITTTATNLLTLQSGCSLRSSASSGYTNFNIAGYTNYGSETSYIIGPVRKLGLSSATRWAFPVGSATQFRPMFLTSVTGDFTVEYKQASPQTDFGATYGTGIDHISDIEYWLITGASSPSANVELSFYDPNSGGVTTMADLRVAHHNGSQWNDEGNTATIGTAGTNGSVTSGTVTTFSPFTLASSTPANPLPLKTIDVTAAKVNRQVNVQWQVNADQDVKEYHLEKSTDGRNFSSIHHTTALRSAQITAYRFTDAASEGRIYYRVKVLLQNGDIVYSSVEMIPGSNETLVVYPNPAKTSLQITGTRTGAQIIITDLQGRTIYQHTANSNSVSVNVQQWPKGYYLLRVVGTGSKTGALKFVVQ